MEVIANIPFKPSPATLLSSLRMDPASDRGREVRRMAEDLQPFLRPKVAYDLRYVEGRGEESVTVGGVTFTSRVLRVNLGEVERVFPFVATCGREAHDYAQQVDDPILKFCLDTILEEALGAAIAALRTHLDERFGLGQTAMMNPGSLEDWPMSEQTKLFSLLGDVRGTIGVELTDSFLMIPIKSVSGIIYPTDVRFESCQLCPREACPKRRAAYDPGLWEKRYRGSV